VQFFGIAQMMTESVKPRQNFSLASTISAFFETTFVRRVNLPRWCRVLLLSRSMPTVCAFPTTWRSGGSTSENARQASA